MSYDREMKPGNGASSKRAVGLRWRYLRSAYKDVISTHSAWSSCKLFDLMRKDESRLFAKTSGLISLKIWRAARKRRTLAALWVSSNENPRYRILRYRYTKRQRHSWPQYHWYAIPTVQCQMIRYLGRKKTYSRASFLQDIGNVGIDDKTESCRAIHSWWHLHEGVDWWTHNGQDLSGSGSNQSPAFDQWWIEI